MSRREEASNLDSENTGQRKGGAIAAGIYMSIRYVAFGATGRACNGCRCAQLDERCCR
jgi:hypothetical protein